MPNVILTKETMSFDNAMRFIVLSVLVILQLLNPSYAQEGTRENDRIVKGEVMLVPFEPMMYMSEIDKKINDETSWSFEQIRENFRRQLEVNLFLKLKQQKTAAVSFYIDSIKMAKDLDYMYQSRSLSYEMLDPKERGQSNKENQKITNGQITVEMNYDSKFMSVKIVNPSILSYMHKKYGVNYFIFINELDIKYDLESYDFATDTYKRKVMVHYTIMDKSKKILSAGIASTVLSSDNNHPKKIVNKAFIPIIDQIITEYTSVVKSGESK